MQSRLQTKAPENGNTPESGQRSSLFSRKACSHWTSGSHPKIRITQKNRIWRYFYDNDCLAKHDAKNIVRSIDENLAGREGSTLKIRGLIAWHWPFWKWRKTGLDSDSRRRSSTTAALNC